MTIVDEFLNLIGSDDVPCDVSEACEMAVTRIRELESQRSEVANAYLGLTRAIFNMPKSAFKRLRAPWNRMEAVMEPVFEEVKLF